MLNKKIIASCAGVVLGIGLTIGILNTSANTKTVKPANAETQLPVYGIDEIFTFEGLSSEARYKTIDEAYLANVEQTKTKKIIATCDFTQGSSAITLSTAYNDYRVLNIDLNGHTWNNAKINCTNASVNFYGEGTISGSAHGSTVESNDSAVLYSENSLRIGEDVTVENTYSGDDEEYALGVYASYYDHRIGILDELNVYGCVKAPTNAIALGCYHAYFHEGCKVDGAILSKNFRIDEFHIYGGTFSSDTNNLEIGDGVNKASFYNAHYIEGGTFTSTNSNIIANDLLILDISGGTFTSISEHNIDCKGGVYLSKSPKFIVNNSSKANILREMDSFLVNSLFGCSFEGCQAYDNGTFTDDYYYVGDTVTVSFVEIIYNNNYVLIEHVKDASKFEIVNTLPLNEVINGVEYTSQIAYIPENHTYEFYFDKIYEAIIHTTTLDYTNSQFYPVSPSNTHYPSLTFTKKAAYQDNYTLPYCFGRTYYYDEFMYKDTDYVKVKVGGAVMQFDDYMSEHPIHYYTDDDVMDENPRRKVVESARIEFDSKKFNANVEIWIDAVPLYEETYTNYDGKVIDGALTWYNNTFPRISIDFDSDTIDWEVFKLQCDLTATESNLYSDNLQIALEIKDAYKDDYVIPGDNYSSPYYSDCFTVKINGEVYDDASTHTSYHIEEYVGDKYLCKESPDDSDDYGEIDIPREDIPDNATISIKIEALEPDYIEACDFGEWCLFMFEYGTEDCEYGGVEGDGSCGTAYGCYYYLEAKAFLFNYGYEYWDVEDMADYEEIPDEKIVIYSYARDEYSFTQEAFERFRYGSEFAAERARYEAWARAVGDADPYNPTSVPGIYKDYYVVEISSDPNPNNTRDTSIGDIIDTLKDRKSKESNALLAITLTLAGFTALLGVAVLRKKGKKSF